MQVTPELHALLKVMPKAYLELQAMLINIQQYKPTWAIGGVSAMPKELDFPSSTTGKWEDEPDGSVDLDAMNCAESTLGKVSLPPKACFVLGKWCTYSLTADLKKGTPQVDLLSWTWMAKTSSGLDDTMALDEPTMKPRALSSGMLYNVCPSSSGSDQP